jgi:hypothetical protein
MLKKLKEAKLKKEFNYKNKTVIKYQNNLVFIGL